MYQGARGRATGEWALPAFPSRRAQVAGLSTGHASLPIRILGIDPGLRRTGWGLIEADGNRLIYVACGSVETREGERWRRGWWRSMTGSAK